MKKRVIEHRARLWRWKGFTLIELLTVIAIIGILAAILLPVLSAAKKKTAQTTCINNLNQIGLGMQMYVEDNNNTFPGIASRFFYGFHSQDWIYWRTNSALYPSFEKSPILASIPSLRRSSLRCPLDISDAGRLAYNYGDDSGPYFFSYSFNGWDLDSNHNNLGMSSVIDNDGNVFPFKESQVRNPSKKAMLVEEPGSLNPRDSPEGNGTIINDGRWMPWGDALTIRHGGKADVTLGDGHVEAVPPEFGSDTNNTLPNL